MWEEPCISGTKGSGTVFFAGCPLGCVYCQNRDISRDGAAGRTVGPSELTAIYHRLADRGVHNINLVTGAHFADSIALSLEGWRRLPVVWNSSGYEKLETLKMLEGKVQIYLPDMKYSDSALAAKYSRAADYPDIARAAIKEMVRQVGPFEMGEDGLLRSGVVIRHLMLPGSLKNTLGVIDWVAGAFKKGTVLFSLMGQYTPFDVPEGCPELKRRVYSREYQRAEEYMLKRGIEDGYVQLRDSAQRDYTPDFSGGGDVKL